MINGKLTKAQMERLLNRLVLKPLRTSQSLHECCLCGTDIRYPEQYRDGGFGSRAHVTCIDARRQNKA